MNELRKTTLRNEVDFLVGFPFKSEGYSSEGVRLLRGDNIAQGTLSWSDAKKWPIYEHGNFEPYELQEGDIVLAMDRPWIDAGLKYASVSRYDLPCLLVQRTARLRGGKNLDTKFLKYVIGSPQFTKYIKFITTGSLVPHISGNQIKDFSVYLPHLSIQKKIAAVLSALDAKIDCNNRINAELEAMAKTLYDYWFVQFDFPFDFAQGKPDQNGKPYKSSGGKMTYNPTLKRDIPAGWEAALIGDVLGKVPTTAKVLNKDILNTGAIPVIDQGQSYICGFTDDRSSLIVPTQPHVVFGDHTRAVKLVNFSYARGADGTQILLSNSPKMPGYLMYQVVSDVDLSSYGYARHFKFLKESTTVLPEQTVAQRYQDVVSPWFEKIKESVFENLELSRLREWLLPMLMNGQVTVK